MAANLTTVSFSLSSGNYIGTQSVTLSCVGANKIFYTTDGTIPADSSGTATGTTQTITGASGVVSVAATEVIIAYSYVTADSPADGAQTAAVYGILPAGVNVNLTPAQVNYLQSILQAQIQAGYASQPFTGTQSTDVISLLAALRNNV